MYIKITSLSVGTIAVTDEYESIEDYLCTIVDGSSGVFDSMKINLGYDSNNKKMANVEITSVGVSFTVCEATKEEFVEFNLLK